MVAPGVAMRSQQEATALLLREGIGLADSTWIK